MPKVVRTELAEEYDLNNQLIIGRDNTLINANNLRLWLRLNTTLANLSNYDSSTISSIAYDGTPSINENDQIGRKTYPSALFDNTDNVNGLVTFTGVNNLTTFTNGSQDLPFSISFFYRRNSATASGDTEYFFYKGDPDALNTDEFYCFYNHASQIMFLNLEDEAENQSKYKTVGIQLQNDVWNHIVITVQFGNNADQDIQFYVNGNLITNTLNAVQESNYSSINAVSDTLVVGANRTGNFEADGYFSEFTVWDKTLTATEVSALYYATIEGWKAKSGFISLPPRVLIKQFDSATGSYPTIARTGDATRKGNYNVRFDDTYTVPFESSFATADIDFGYSLSGGSSSMFPNDFDNIVLTDADGNSATIVFLNTSLIATTDPLPDYPVYYTDKLDRVVIAERFAAQINDNAGLKLKAKVTKVKKASLGLGIGTRYTSVVVTITQSVPGLLGNKSITRSTQTFTERTATVKSARGIDVFTYYHYGLTIPSAFTGGKELSVNRTTNLPANALRLQQQAYATPNILETQLDGNGSIFKGVADNNIRFTPGEDLGPFTDSRINLGDSLFYQEGTPSSVYPGFSSPLKSKTQITFELPVNSDLTLRPSITTGSHKTMAYYNFDEKKFEPVGRGIPLINYDFDAAGSALSNQLNDLMIGFTGVSQINTGGTGSYDKIAGQPSSIYGFPIHPKFHATGSQTYEMTNKLTSPFLVEKISVEFKAKFNHKSPTSTFDPIDDPGAVHTFFVLNQKSSAGIFETNNFYSYRSTAPKDFVNPVKLLPNYLTSSIPSTIQLSENGNPVTVNTTREMLGYGQIFVSSKFDLQANSERRRELNISGTMINGGLSNDEIEASGSFILNFESAVSSRLDPESKKSQPVVPFTLGSGMSAVDYFTAPKFSGNALGSEEYSSGRNIKSVYSTPSFENSSTLFNSEPVKAIDVKNRKFTNPYLLFPGDKLIFGWQPSQAASMIGPTLGYPRVYFPEQTFKITLYGSLVKDNKEFHDTLNQPLTSKAVHESIHHLNPVLDQFEVEASTEYVGTYQDDFFPGKNKNLNPVTRLGLAVTSSVSQSLEVGDSYAFQRNVTLFNRSSTYFDSYLPSLLSLIQSDPNATRFSLPTYNQNDIRFPIEYVGTLPNPFNASSDYTASYSASTSEKSFLTSRNRFIFDDDSSFSRNWRRRASISALRPQGFDADLLYKGASGFNNFCKNSLSNPYSVDSTRFISQTEDFSIVVGQLSKIEYDEDSSGAQPRTSDLKDSAAIASGSFPKLIGITGQKLRELIVGNINFNDTTLFYNRQGGSGDGSTISGAGLPDDYPTLTASFQETDFNIPTPRNVPYGMISITPLNQRYVFRGSRYGQFSDLLHSPGNTKFFNSGASRRRVKKGEQAAAVKVVFVTGSRNTSLSVRSFKKSPPGTQVDLNPLFQSSNLSTECTSSLPFYDDETPRNRSYPSLFV